ncbi:ribosomal protein S18-alanine N-acetyltransferase [Microbulbifer sp. MLAF003]|uniref:ribosomal protein S18-alanine N-acetyltransferase n=1 Tax=Microbulbifer TaxID=48073 RepID=UPI00036BB9E8|nr:MULTISPECIES: ribosomal protein S18-alanine N-acetyltransferase [Microbulbifer]WHI50685.1 ribosomal protein S18-alanine N-acetyltransferase [Microbulbifer sp. MLAF003]
MSLPAAVGLRKRLAGVTDCAALAALARSAHSHPWNETQYRQSLESGHQGWLLENEGEMIACCVISHLFDEVEILDVAVAPNWRRHGIAERLLKGLITELPDDIRRLLLEVRSSNLAALSLYRKLGFSEDGLRKNYYPAENGSRENAVLMSLALDDSGS